ncbi:hypothetical protein Tco_0493854 [Tanacetum coccineum]
MTNKSTRSGRRQRPATGLRDTQTDENNTATERAVKKATQGSHPNPLIENFKKRNKQGTIKYHLQQVKNANLKWRELQSAERHAYYERLSKLQGKGFRIPRVPSGTLFYGYKFEETLKYKRSNESFIMMGIFLLITQFERESLFLIMVMLTAYVELEVAYFTPSWRFLFRIVMKKRMNTFRANSKESMSKERICDDERIDEFTGYYLAVVIAEPTLYACSCSIKQKRLISGVITCDKIAIRSWKILMKVMVVFVICISADSSEESVGSSPAIIILYYTITLAAIPPVVPAIILPVIHDDILALSTEFDPSVDPSSPEHAPIIPSTSPFLYSSDSSETSRDYSDSDSSERPPSPGSHEATVAQWRSKVVLRSSSSGSSSPPPTLVYYPHHVRFYLITWGYLADCLFLFTWSGGSPSVDLPAIHLHSSHHHHLGKRLDLLLCSSSSDLPFTLCCVATSDMPGPLLVTTPTPIDNVYTYTSHDLFIYPPIRTPRDSVAYHQWRAAPLSTMSPTTLERSTAHTPGALSPARADLLPSHKRFRGSSVASFHEGSIKDSYEASTEVEGDDEAKNDAESSAGDTVEIRVDVVIEPEVPDDIPAPTIVERLSKHEDVIQELYNHMLEFPAQRFNDIEEDADSVQRCLRYVHEELMQICSSRYYDRKDFKRLKTFVMRRHGYRP